MIFNEKKLVHRLDELEGKIDYLIKIAEDLFMSIDDRNKDIHARKASMKNYTDTIINMLESKGADTAMFKTLINSMNLGGE